MAYCPHCGQKQEQTTAYCPGCGKKNGEDDRPRGSLLPTFITFGLIVAFALFVVAKHATLPRVASAGGVAGDLAAVVAPQPTPTAVAYSCADAQAAVQAYHKVFWPVMAQFYPSLTISCDPTMQQRHGATADQPVVISWSTSAKGYTAMYLVASDGTVTPDDPVATQLDEFAKYSPLVLKAALAGL